MYLAQPIRVNEIIEVCLESNLKRELEKRDGEIYQLKREMKDLKGIQQAQLHQYDLHDLQLKNLLNQQFIQAQSETISTMKEQISILQEQMANFLKKE